MTTVTSVVDPPEEWIEADKLGMTAREELEDRIARRQLLRRSRSHPPITSTLTTPRYADDEPIVLSDDELDRLDPEQHGRARGQIEGRPEDGDSFFDVVE